MTINGIPYSSPRSINLQGTSSVKGSVLRFARTSSTNPLDSSSNGLYINASNQLIFSAQGTSTTLGAAGAASSAPSFDAIYAGDQTLTVSGATLTLNGTHGSNDVLTITSTGAGTGDLIQITNVGTGNDIEGTNDTWHFTKVGDATLNMLVAAGDAGADSITLTAGDVLISDGSITAIDADNAATLSLTNNTATTASVFVLVGSGTFTGNTTSSFLTLTPSGLTTGTAMYLPVAALTTGKGIHIVANAVTDGLILNITSSSTVHTATGRLLNIASTAATNTNAVLNEFATAANDETVLLRLTSSDLLAGGKILHIDANEMTTGTAIDAGTLDALTTGMGISIASTSTGMTTGSLARFSTGTTGAVATNGIVSIRATGAYTSTANVGLLDVQSSGLVGTGTLVNFKTTGAAQLTNTILNVEASGFTTGYDGTMVRIKNVGTTGTATMVAIIADGITSGGRAMDISVDALTTGLGLNIDNTGGAMTTGSLLAVTAQGTGAIATNGIISFTHTGAFTSTSAVNGGFVEIKANDTTAGTVLNLVADALTTGIGVQLSNATSAMTSGSLLRVTASGVGTVATNGIVSITHGGIFVSTSNAGVLDVRATAMVGTASNGTLVNFMTTAAAQVDTTVLNVENSGFTTGYTGTMLRVKSPTTTGTGIVVGVIADGITSGGTAMDISTDALTTGIALNIANSGGAMTTGSLLRVAAQGTGAIATNGIISFTHTGDFTSTTAVNGGFVEIKANDTLAGTIFNLVGDALTTGIGVQLSNATSAMTTGSLLRVTTSGTGAIATNGIVSIVHDGIYTSTSNAGVLDVTATATVAGTVMRIRSTAAAQTTAQLLNVTASGYTTGYTGNVVQFTGVSTTGAGNVLSVVSANSTAGTAVTVTANSLTTGVGLLVTSSGTITATSEGLVNIVGTGITTGSALKIDLTEGTLTTGKYINCFDDTGAVSVFSIGENGVILFSDFSEDVTASNVITADESGSVFFLNSGTEFASTLPAPVAGLHFTFIVKAAPSGANYTIVTNGGSNIIQGQAVVNCAAVPAVDEDSINLVSAAAAVGDDVELWCDGTNWYVAGQGVAAGAITFTVT